MNKNASLAVLYDRFDLIGDRRGLRVIAGGQDPGQDEDPSAA
jgi:hypothetical protein